MDTLEAMEVFFKIPTSEWQAASLLVPKPGSKANMRMAIDLRPGNEATFKESWPIPHLESEIQDFGSSTCFETLDFVLGYWMLPLHGDLYIACRVVTPKIISSCRRVLSRLANAASYFQSTVEPMFQSRRQCTKAWLDDFFYISKAKTLFLTIWRHVLTYLACIFFSASKCVFFAKQLKWCDQIISDKGYTMDQSRFDGLKDMDTPKLPMSSPSSSTAVNGCQSSFRNSLNESLR